MGTEIGEAFVNLNVVDDEYKNKLNKAQGLFAGFGKTLLRIGVAAAVAAGAAIAAGAAFATNALAKEQKEIAKLEAVLKATGGAAELSSQQLQDHASELQSMTTFSNEAIIANQAILATFKQIKGDEFKRATEAILDMAIVLDQDARSGAIQLGKALNDPIKGVASLSEVGIQFTDVQRKQIEQFVKTNQIAKAQGIILAELEGQMGGAARAARDTLGGAMAGLINDLADTGKEFLKDSGLAEQMARAINGLSAIIRDNSAAIVENLSAFVRWSKDAARDATVAVIALRAEYQKLALAVKFASLSIAEGAAILTGRDQDQFTKALDDTAAAYGRVDREAEAAARKVQDFFAQSAKDAEDAKEGTEAVADAVDQVAAAVKGVTFTGLTEGVRRAQGLIDPNKILGGGALKKDANIAEKGLKNDEKMLAEAKKQTRELKEIKKQNRNPSPIFVGGT